MNYAVSHTTSSRISIDAITISRSQIAWFAGVFMLASVVIYVYLLISSLITVVAYKGVQEDVINITQEISMLEARHAQALQTIDYAYAIERGFVAVSDRVFVNEDDFAFAQ